MPASSERNLSNFKISESFWRLMQTDPIDDRTLIDGTGSLVSYLAISGTIDSWYLKGDGSQITNINLSGSNIVSSSGQLDSIGIGPNSSPTFANISVLGNITANQYIVSSSVMYQTQSYSSGSTIHGNSNDDTHQFTGSMYVSGSVYGSFVGDGSGLTNIVALGTISSSQQIADMGFITSSTWDSVLFKPSGIVSSSIQTIDNLVGTNIVSGSAQRGVLGLATTDNVTFGIVSASGAIINGNVLIDGTLTARTFVISSSVISYQTLYASGSTVFGDTADDTHQFTGSVYISGSTYSPSFNGIFEGAVSSSQQISALGFISGSGSFGGTIDWMNVVNKPSGLVSSSYQTILNLSGSNIVSGSGQRGVLGLAETDSPTFANLNATHASLGGNLAVGGTITARTFIISSSVVNYETLNISGSSVFGDTIDDTHQFTGSMFISGSFIVPSTNTLSPSAIDGDLVLYGGNLYIRM